MTEREFWLALRRALLMVASVIERRYANRTARDMSPPVP